MASADFFEYNEKLNLKASSLLYLMKAQSEEAKTRVLTGDEGNDENESGMEGK